MEGKRRLCGRKRMEGKCEEGEEMREMVFNKEKRAYEIRGWEWSSELGSDERRTGESAKKRGKREGEKEKTREREKEEKREEEKDGERDKKKVKEKEKKGKRGKRGRKICSLSF